MKRPSCPRLFEVEAMRDGRLVGPERGSFERHVASCAACSREAQALEELARSVRASTDARDELDELHVRRERTRLLAAFDGTLVRNERAPRRWLWSVALVALLLGIVAAWRTSAPRSADVPTGPRPVPAQSTHIQADSSALYSKRAEDGRERIILERGMLRIQVTHAHAPGEPALLVTLPDGELEDAGTTFTVTVAEGRTTHVKVEEGSIVLRLRGRLPIVLRAGEAWSVDVRPPSVDASAASSEPAAGSASASTLPPTAGPTPPVTSSVDPNASKDFREAMAALKAEDHRRAATLFARFLDEHARDSRAEDAAYLRVVALHRGGDERERKDAARSYLLAFPAGFRRAEVEKLAE